MATYNASTSINVSASHHARFPSRFFTPSLDAWLGTRGAAAHLEQCEGGRGSRCVSALHKLWWWPFYC